MPRNHEPSRKSPMPPVPEKPGKTVIYRFRLPITSRQRAIPPMMSSGSVAETGVVGVAQTTPHPPGHPLPDGGQARLPPAGQGGGVQTMAGVSQITPHPPGHPLPDGGQARLPPAGQGGGVQITDTDGTGEASGMTAGTGDIRTRRRRKTIPVYRSRIPFHAFYRY